MLKVTVLVLSPLRAQAVLNEATFRAGADYPKSNPRHTTALAQ
ncbi:MULTISPECIES: hypothetical protein [Lysobacter]|nr:MULTISPECIES: hypothetical protein [Lysobacter]